jgi:chromosome transmission fidelity protein 1
MWQRTDATSTKSESVEDSFFELDDYDSDAETGTKASGNGSHDIDGLSASTIALLERFRGHNSGRQHLEDETDDQIKIFYCSRTHSQLSQFAHELQRVDFPSSLPPQQDMPKDASENTEVDEIVKHLSLGSRKQLCINPRVASLGNATAINERCMDLQQPGVAADKKCPYLPSKETEATQLHFRDRTLAAVQDIEDIGRVGKQLGICPYYATRPVVKQSEVSTLVPSVKTPLSRNRS